MRQLAWLQAVPEAPDGSKAKKDERTRLARLQAEEIEVELPGATLQYLLGYLYEMGPGMAGAMGEVPLSHGEIESWQRNTGIRLTPWEARTIRRLSIAHVEEAYAARKHDAPAPYAGEDGDPGMMLRAAEMRDSIRRMADL